MNEAEDWAAVKVAKEHQEAKTAFSTRQNIDILNMDICGEPEVWILFQNKDRQFSSLYFITIILIFSGLYSNMNSPRTPVAWARGCYTGVECHILPLIRLNSSPGNKHQTFPCDDLMTKCLGFMARLPKGTTKSNLRDVLEIQRDHIVHLYTCMHSCHLSSFKMLSEALYMSRVKSYLNLNSHGDPNAPNHNFCSVATSTMP